MLLTPLGILRILNLICGYPGWLRDEGAAISFALKVMLFVSKQGLFFCRSCLAGNDYWHNKYCVLTFISGGSKKLAKQRDEWEVTVTPGPVPLGAAQCCRCPELHQSGKEEGPDVFC